MSFSSEVKKEAGKVMGSARHCQLAELAAMIIYGGNSVTVKNEPDFGIVFQSDHLYLVEKFALLLHKLFRMNLTVEEFGTSGRKRNYRVCVENPADVLRVLQGTKLLEQDGSINRFVRLDRYILLQQECCRRAFLRGAFLMTGAISDPNKSYHMEIACNDSFSSAQLTGLICSMGINAKSIIRKKYHVVYVKESDEISTLIAAIGSGVEMMEFENIRILREMRGNVNRIVNCETANINKTVAAAVRQVEDIEYIRDTIGLESLPKVLDEIAQLRLQYREASLLELGSLLDPPVGKSGVNHRLRKLGKIAEDLRENRRSM